MRVLITGDAGFIGMHLARRLLSSGHVVLGYDGLTPYYDVALKRRRRAILMKYPAFAAIESMLEDKGALEKAVGDFSPEIVVHLAAQAGVRYSLTNPEAYISTNIAGTFNLLEIMKKANPSHLLIASTSSIYGGNEEMPFGEADRTDFPMSLYAATKKACEAMSHSYAHLYKIPTTCFRFFTVYGPWGRPDMALFKFVSAIAKDQPIEVYGHGRMKRDFTYIDDLVEGIVRLMAAVPVEGRPVMGDSLSPVAPWRAVNIGGGEPLGLMPFIEIIEAALGKKAVKNMLPAQQGDVTETFADAGLLKALTGFAPRASATAGVKAFVDWYRTEYAHG
jgi:UDP-glucuronate 4-epimerase